MILVSAMLILLGVALFAFNRFVNYRLSRPRLSQEKYRSIEKRTLIGLVAAIGLILGVSKFLTDFEDIPDTIVSGSLVILSLFVLSKYEALSLSKVAISLLFAIGIAFVVFRLFGVKF